MKTLVLKKMNYVEKWYAFMNEARALANSGVDVLYLDTTFKSYDEVKNVVHVAINDNLIISQFKENAAWHINHGDYEWLPLLEKFFTHECVAHSCVKKNVKVVLH